MPPPFIGRCWHLARIRSVAEGCDIRLVPGSAWFMLLPMDFTEIDREDFRNLLVEIGLTRMPFGKFGKQAYPPHGVPLIDLPPEYLSWFQQRGFPKGRLGELMAHVCEIKDVGMDCVFDPIRQANGGRYPLHHKRTKTFEF